MKVDLLNFAVQELAHMPLQLARSEQRPDDLPTTQQIADQMHEALGHRRVSAREKKRQEDMENAAASLQVELPAKPGEATEEKNADTDETRDTNAG